MILSHGDSIRIRCNHRKRISYTRKRGRKLCQTLIDNEILEFVYHDLSTPHSDHKDPEIEVQIRVSSHLSMSSGRDCNLCL